MKAVKTWDECSLELKKKNGSTAVCTTYQPLFFLCVTVGVLKALGGNALSVVQGIILNDLKESIQKYCYCIFVE